MNIMNYYHFSILDRQLDGVSPVIPPAHPTDDNTWVSVEIV